jgi:hypothetical protein
MTVTRAARVAHASLFEDAVTGVEDFNTDDEEPDPRTVDSERELQ